MPIHVRPGAGPAHDTDRQNALAERRSRIDWDTRHGFLRLSHLVGVIAAPLDAAGQMRRDRDQASGNTRQSPLPAPRETRMITTLIN